MSYADLTFRDKNPIKRWLQEQRLVSAVQLCGQSRSTPDTICDFGSGNGELCKLLAGHYQNTKLICYEPMPSLLSEARENLATLASVEFCDDIRKVTSGTVDVVFCLEVFEHLPPAQTSEALETICDLLKPDGKIVIGVPVEVGIPALYKGIFRMSRRYGGFDASLKNVVSAFLWRPPKTRPTHEIAPGFSYYFEHMGFDFRRFREILGGYFHPLKVSSSPFTALGTALMPEVYFVAENPKKPQQPEAESSV
ncbi:class I SAM-dependent methyltransferase [Halieaceae bacterium IMCC14734]|uniref:Class I SAM-dependent methyltransferase n=1 Tax=Candidatus Litorirhabdus singularis TaxID=2518993 RepID=A0ABT3TDH7_9GAMM|nr:class I SAM-dependent methyltransferase [Candidatus Litorirhabdus singularis]MCX2979880.1 class I SAM-dependent methyltransferase [Candidatus Litorirhabdus singularis]